MDDINRKIISQLQVDARTTLEELAQITGFTSMGVKKRLAKLVESGAIKNQALMNPSAFGLTPAMILLEMNDAAAMQDVMNRFKECPRVVHFFKTIGGYNLIALVIAENKDTLDSISVEKCSLRSSPGIRRSEFYPISDNEFAQYLQIREYLAHKGKDKAPCKVDCCTCARYEAKKCVGCPSTVHYRGTLQAVFAVTVDLKKVAKLEIVSLLDNTVDFLSSETREEIQSFWHWTKAHGELPFAEHGFSMLVRVFSGENTCTVLFDTGVSADGVVMNAKLMGIDLREVSYVVLSHGHYDHFGGLSAVVKAINRDDLQIIAHEDTAKRRATTNSEGELREHPTFPESKELTSAEFINTKKPLLIASDLACITGEIPRTVDFEKGLINNRIYRDDSWRPDPLILDERGLVFNVEGKGLVVISGCAHAGIINTIRYAQKITETAKVYAVLGGFHLSGRKFEKRIEPTVEELKRINPELIVPSHCTGWRALYAIREKLPNAFVFSSVGNLYSL